LSHWKAHAEGVPVDLLDRAIFQVWFRSRFELGEIVLELIDDKRAPLSLLNNLSETSGDSWAGATSQFLRRRNRFKIG